ncbi:hypothetical protein PybrP1_008919 [[Pythium] brassicae (nom. inval.)]|nr:hypothetical protein PybrP1_008919 [[Pythium] brassicae (nom. inval.)]
MITLRFALLNSSHLLLLLVAVADGRLLRLSDFLQVPLARTTQNASLVASAMAATTQATKRSSGGLDGDEEPPEPPPQPKRTRPDVAARRVSRRALEETTVKTTMAAAIRHPCVKTLAWNDILGDMNKAVLEASILSNIYGTELPVINQTYFNRCISALTRGEHAHKTSPDPVFAASVALYRSWRGGCPLASTPHIATSWQQYAALEMSTNATNSMRENFYTRLKKHLKLEFRIDGRAAYKVANEITAIEYGGSDEKVLQWRSRVPRHTSGRDHGMIDYSPNKMLPLFYKLLYRIKLELETSKEYVRPFTLLPTKRGFVPSHFRMCNHGLYALLRRTKTKHPDNWKAFCSTMASAFPREWAAAWVSSEGGRANEGASSTEQPPRLSTDIARWNGEAWWKLLFKIDSFTSQNRSFGGTITTDGYAVSISLTRPKSGPEVPVKPEDLDYFGDWSNTDPEGLIKHCPRGPVKQLERMLKVYYRIQGFRPPEFTRGQVYEHTKHLKVSAACLGESSGCSDSPSTRVLCDSRVRNDLNPSILIHGNVDDHRKDSANHAGGG